MMGPPLSSSSMRCAHQPTTRPTAKSGVADSILANDVDDKATVATVYITGRFHREKVIAAEGDTVDAHEEELRGKGILFAALK